MYNLLHFSQPSAQNKFSVRKSKSAKKVQLNQDKYFDFLYSGKKNTDNQVNENNNINNIQIPANVQLIRFEKEIEFGKALEVLHNELYSFKLMDDE